MAALTYNTAGLRPTFFDRALLLAAGGLRKWAVRRMVRRTYFNDASDRRRDLTSQLRIGL